MPHRTPWLHAVPAVALALLTGCPGAFYFSDADAGRGCDAGCPAGLVCGRGGCVECAADADCSAPLSRCLPSSGRCVECVLDAECGGGHVCEQVTHHCQQACSEDNECASDKCDPVGGLQVCVACSDSGQCAGAAGTPYCDLERGACVRCRGDADCSGAEPRCDRLTGACRECSAAADCGGAPCGRDGRCAL